MFHKLFYLSIFNIFMLNAVADSHKYGETHAAVRGLLDTVFNAGEHGVKTVHTTVDDLWDDFDPIKEISKVLSVSDDLEQAIANISASLDHYDLLKHVLHPNEGKEVQGDKSENSEDKKQLSEKTNGKDEHSQTATAQPEEKATDAAGTKPPATDAPKTRKRRNTLDERNLSRLIETVVSQVLSNGGHSHGILTPHLLGKHHPGTDTDLNGLIETVVSQLLANGYHPHGQHSLSSKHLNHGNPQIGVNGLIETVASQLLSNGGAAHDKSFDNLRPHSIHALKRVITELLRVFEEMKHTVHNPTAKMYINLILSAGRALLANFQPL